MYQLSTPENVELLMTVFERCKLLVSWKIIFINEIAPVSVQSVYVNIVVHIFKAINLLPVTVKCLTSVVSLSDFYTGPLSNWSPVTALLPWNEISEQVNFRIILLCPSFFFLIFIFIPLSVLHTRTSRRITTSKQ